MLFDDNKNIIVEPLLNPVNEKTNNIKILNLNNECIICKNNLLTKDIILVNNFCKCFEGVKICRICFFLWFIKSKKCIICCEPFYDNINDIYNNNVLKIYDSELSKSIYDVLSEYDNIRDRYKKFKIVLDDVRIDINDNESISSIASNNTNNESGLVNYYYNLKDSCCILFIKSILLSSLFILLIYLHN
jgi:uncharacterized protein YrzB (UPF0473 family)